MVYLKDYRGRLGNNLFQIATTIGLADQAAVGYSVPVSKYSSLLGNLNYHVDPPDSCPIIRLPIMSNRDITPITYNAILTGISIRYQNHFYFSNSGKKIIDLFTANLKLKDIDRCVVHVRLTDYLDDKTRDHLRLLDVNYYNKAIDVITSTFNNVDVCLITDDPVNCKNMFGTKYEIISNDEISDLSYIASCRYVVMSNSTFSWWGAYLNKTKSYVVAPDVWYGPIFVRKRISTVDVISGGNLFNPLWPRTYSQFTVDRIESNL